MHPCPSCNKAFQSPSAVFNHRRATGHCYCRRCQTTFQSEGALKNHKHSCRDHACGTCGTDFPKLEGLHMHQRQMKHSYCASCDLCFGHEPATYQHKRREHDLPCDQCNRTFKAVEGLQQHQLATGHRPETKSHQQTKIHPVQASEFRCLECQRNFSSGQALTQHLENKQTHQAPRLTLAPSKDGSYRCGPCKREFVNSLALRSHLESVVHRPLSKFRCLASTECKACFTSPSAFLHHLESGACRSGMTRAMFDKLIQNHDPGHVVTFGTQEQALLQSAPEDSMSSSPLDCGISPSSDQDSDSDTYSEPGGVPLTFSDFIGGDSISKSPRPTRLKNGKLACPICPEGSKAFGTFQALQNHIGSAAHAPKLYHCPISSIPAVTTKKNKDALIENFSTFSGMAQHIESGACKGGKKMLEDAVGLVEEKLGEMGFKNVRLLN